jgi:hypothetical protein
MIVIDATQQENASCTSHQQWYCKDQQDQSSSLYILILIWQKVIRQFTK